MMKEHAIAEPFTLFGFWLYLMTDCVLFAALFATYAVLHNGTYGGPSSKDLFEMPFALTETLILLTSSFTCGLGLLSAQEFNKKRLLFWFAITALLGASFIYMEVSEFHKFITLHAGPSRSAFLSSFFTLVATHGCHISVGLLWALILFGLIFSRGLTPKVLRSITCFSLFWHFLDVVWVFIFTFVYLMGA